MKIVYEIRFLRIFVIAKKKKFKGGKEKELQINYQQEISEKNYNLIVWQHQVLASFPRNGFFCSGMWGGMGAT